MATSLLVFLGPRYRLAVGSDRELHSMLHQLRLSKAYFMADRQLRLMKAIGLSSIWNNMPFARIVDSSTSCNFSRGEHGRLSV